MKKVYDAPGMEIEKFTAESVVCSTSDAGINNGNVDETLDSEADYGTATIAEY
jgi:hypothetical protein